MFSFFFLLGESIWCLVGAWNGMKSAICVTQEFLCIKNCFSRMSSVNVNADGIVMCLWGLQWMGNLYHPRDGEPRKLNAQGTNSLIHQVFIQNLTLSPLPGALAASSEYPCRDYIVEWTASGGESSGRSDAGMHGAKLEYLVGTINANNVPLSGARDSVALAHARADFSLYRDAVNDDEDMGEESAAALSGNSSSDFLALARARLDYTDSRYADDEGREGEATTYSVESNNEDDQLVSDGQDDVMNFEGTRDGDEDDDEQGDWSQHPTTSNAEEDGRDSDTATTTREVISWSILSDDELEAEINCRKQDEEIDESEDSDDSDFIYRLTTKSTSTASTSAASVLTSTSAATTKRTFSAISLLTSSSSAATRSFSTIAEEGTAESALGAVATAIQNSRRRSSSSSNNIDADRAAGAIVNEISPDVRKRSVVVTKQSQLAENKVSPAPRPISVATSSIATAAMKEVGKSRRSSADGGRREIGASPVIVSPLQLSPRLVVARRRPAEPLLLIAGDSDVESIAGSYSGGSNAASSAAMSRRFFESSPLQAPAPLLITTPTSAGSCGSRKSFRHPSDLPM